MQKNFLIKIKGIKKKKKKKKKRKKKRGQSAKTKKLPAIKKKK
jgi:hypothetical protein